ncbi:hypothetical protein QN355_11725 [Cryobacterium sp. 10S3]|uniref:hypothetical protein n=1 Tax=Cryobacterium sp. 10S3 TaxID=3048582 RepID=UPI002AC8AD63|nr:hypothetical protein [Cryobacterium sp. 10S3]MEB0287223.1 hypothetical protein [Cryobacterium sp. 10S3]WPX14178.1 hypothetical protein RHM57_02045 [Cryobacterium sp. 10S3]
MKKVTKLFRSSASTINESDKTVVFKISDGKVDRQGEIVDQKSWDFTEYLDNPILIASHDSSDLENGLGTCEELWYESADDATYGRFKFATEASDKALLAWKLIVAGVLRTVSVGFISEKTEYNAEGIAILFNNKLIETSCVLVPANPRAIALSYREGSITRKDATWLMDSMKKEAEFLKEQLTKDETFNVKEKQVEELTQQVTNLTALVSKLAESQVALTEAVAAQTPAPETEEAKAEREAAEADAVAAQKVIDDQVEADRIAKEASDAANDGGNDQSGAEDEDAELTAEQEAELDAMLEDNLAKLETANQN